MEQKCVIFGKFHGGKPGFERWLQSWVCESSQSILSKGSDKDRFDATVMGVDVVILGKTSGVPEKGPTGSSVAGASIQLRIDKGFGNPDGVAVRELPIIGQASEVESKNA